MAIIAEPRALSPLERIAGRRRTRRNTCAKAAEPIELRKNVKYVLARATHMDPIERRALAETYGLFTADDSVAPSGLDHALLDRARWFGLV